MGTYYQPMNVTRREYLGLNQPFAAKEREWRNNVAGRLVLWLMMRSWSGGHVIFVNDDGCWDEPDGTLNGAEWSPGPEWKDIWAEVWSLFARDCATDEERKMMDDYTKRRGPSAAPHPTPEPSE